MLKKMLPDFGIEPERLRLEWVSAAEAQRFAQVITDFTNELKKLGPIRRYGLKKEAKTTRLLEGGANG